MVKYVKVKALVTLRTPKGAVCLAGGVCEVSESAAAILVKNKQAEIVKEEIKND